MNLKTFTSGMRIPAMWLPARALESNSTRSVCFIFTTASRRTRPPSGNRLWPLSQGSCRTLLPQLGMHSRIIIASDRRAFRRSRKPKQAVDEIDTGPYAFDGSCVATGQLLCADSAKANYFTPDGGFDSRRLPKDDFASCREADGDGLLMRIGWVRRSERNQLSTYASARLSRPKWE